MSARGYKWVVLALLSGAFFFHQADRALFGLLTIPIQEDLGLTDLQIGWVNTALFCTLAVTTPFAGMLGDRVSRKWIITLSLLFWSLMTACTGFVGGICGLVFFRSIATGGGESFYAPSAFALLASHHRETRSIAFSVHQSALYVGLMFSGALVAWSLHLLGGWRPVFFVFGGLGFLLGIVFCFALKERPTDAGATTAGQAAVARPAVPSFTASLRAYFCNPSALRLDTASSRRTSSSTRRPRAVSSIRSSWTSTSLPWPRCGSSWLATVRGTCSGKVRCLRHWAGMRQPICRPRRFEPCGIMCAWKR